MSNINSLSPSTNARQEQNIETPNSQIELTPSAQNMVKILEKVGSLNNNILNDITDGVRKKDYPKNANINLGR